MTDTQRCPSCRVEPKELKYDARIFIGHGALKYVHDDDCMIGKAVCSNGLWRCSHCDAKFTLSNKHFPYFDGGGTASLDCPICWVNAEAERSYRHARYERLRQIAVELLSMMFGSPYQKTDHGHLVSIDVGSVNQPKGSPHTWNDVAWVEYFRTEAISKSWFEKLLGELVERNESIFSLAERWDSIGRPKAEACAW